MKLNPLIPGPSVDSHVYLLARAVSEGVMASLFMAQREPDREAYWRAHADKLEQKFTNMHGKHYAYFLGILREEKVKETE